MGLDIRVKVTEVIKCPHCGGFIERKTMCAEDSCGSVWRAFLSRVGYDEVDTTGDYKWYGEDMTLNAEQAKVLFDFLKRHDLYNDENIRHLVADAILSDKDIVINANW